MRATPFKKLSWCGRARGFALFEVMLATTIFGLTVVGLLLSLNAAQDGAKAAREDEVRQARLQSLLAGLRVKPMQVGTEKIDTDSSGTTFETQTEALNMANQDREVLMGLYKVTARARWTEAGNEEKLEATLMLYRP